MSTVLAYVEAGAGIGILTDSVTTLGLGRPVRFRPLAPEQHVELDMVWSKGEDSPASAAFRHLIEEWLAENKLWPRLKSEAA